jgi:hypothetical protein
MIETLVVVEPPSKDPDTCQQRSKTYPFSAGGFQTSSQHFEMILECGWRSV